MAESTEIHEAPGLGRRVVSMLKRRDVWLGLLAALLAGWAYRDLLGLGTRFGFALGVEYWLFQPSDSAPLIILLISGWLLYRRSNRFATLSVSSSEPWLALPLYAACFLFYGWSVYTGSLDMRVFSFVSFLFGSIALVFGRPGLHALWLPAAFVLFAVRIPAPLMLEVLYYLQMWTAEYAGWLLYTIGETAFVSGDQIIRASQQFQVVEGCSGMRSLETLTMLTVLMADLFGRRRWHALLLLLSAPIVAFALNGVRVLTIILNPHSDISTIHNAQGIAVLMVGLLIIYGFDELLERVLPESASPRWRPLPSGGASRSRNRLAVAACCCGVSIGLSLLGLVGPVWEHPGPPSTNLSAALGQALSEWPAEKRTRDFNFEGSARFDQYFHYDYALPEGRVDVFVATSDPGQLGTSILSPMTTHPASGFAEVRRLEDVPQPGGPPITARVMRRDKQEVLVWHWFLGRSSLVSESLRSLLALGRSPFRRDARPTVVRLTTEIDDSGPSARAEAVKKLGRVHDRMKTVLSAASSESGS